MNISIQIIKVGKPQSKGTYNAIEVTYKNLSQGGKVEGKNVVDFGDYAHVFEAAKGWQEDQIVNIQNEKIKNAKSGKEFWTWVDVQEAGEDQPQPLQEKAAVPKDVKEAQATPAGKQQWVPDADKQRLIVRQNSITNAVAYEGNNAGNSDDVLKTAEKFFNWVFEAPKPVKAKKVVEAEVD